MRKRRRSDAMAWVRSRSALVLTLIVATACCGVGVGAEEIGVSVDAKQGVGRMSTWFEPSSFASWAYGVNATRGTDYVGEFIQDGGGSTGGIVRLTVEDAYASSTSVEDYRQRLRRRQMGDLCKR